MPAPIASQTQSPLFRTTGVWKGIGVGLAAGVILTLGFIHISTCINPAATSGEGRNRADVVGGGADGGIVIPASSCDVSHVAGGVADMSGPVRFRVTLVRVVDGDTIRVVWHGEDIAVRLLGIDAPERNQPGAKESAACLRSLLDGTETVDIEFEHARPGRDSLGRLLAYVWRGNLHLNLEMLRRGHADLYKKGGKGRYTVEFKQALKNRVEPGYPTKRGSY